MTEHVEIEELEDGIVQMRLARPPVNALNPVFLNGIADELAHLAARSSVRAVILTGTGKVLSAGMDLKEAMAFDRAGQSAMAKGLNACYAAAYEFPKPLIVAANGHAIAGGLFFVLTGYYRVVSEVALLGLTEVRVAVSFPVVANAIACHELGPNAARRIMLSGRNVSASEALGMGFADAVVEPDFVMAAALDKAREYALIPPKAYAAVKAQMRAGVVAGYRGAVDNGDDPALESWFSDETLVAAKALLAGG